MKSEQINRNTVNAISAMRAEVERGFLKNASGCWSFIAGYTMNQPIFLFTIWLAIRNLADEGKITH